MKHVTLLSHQIINKGDQFFRNGRWLNASASIGDIPANWSYPFRRKVKPETKRS
jgi:hypothetical protein